jgi:hypothetical protein
MLAATGRPKEEFQMKARFTFGVIGSLLIATLAWSATNLNSSKSNIYRLTYPGDLVSQEQAKAILAELDKWVQQMKQG